MTFKTKLQNGIVPLPSRLRTLAGVSDGDPVSVTLIQGRFVVTPAGRSHSAKPPSRKSRKAVLSRLRAENARLKLDKEILKKAAAYFAKESM